MEPIYDEMKLIPFVISYGSHSYLVYGLKFKNILHSSDTKGYVTLAFSNLKMSGKEFINVWKYLNGEGAGLILNPVLMGLFSPLDIHKYPDSDLLPFLDYHVPTCRIGTGSMGEVLDVGDGKVVKKLQYVLEAGEGKIAEIAGKAGIGPIVYKYNDTMILMQKLIGPTLAEKYPYRGEDITLALDLYYKLLTEYGIAQKDLKGQNLMFGCLTCKLYLLDYGIAESKVPANIPLHMISMAKLLVESLTTRASTYGGDSFWNDPDVASQSSSFIVVENAASAWIQRKFPGHKLDIFFSPHIFKEGGKINSEIKSWMISKK
jgi:hypothetical protein